MTPPPIVEPGALPLRYARWRAFRRSLRRLRFSTLVTAASILSGCTLSTSQPFVATTLPTAIPDSAQPPLATQSPIPTLQPSGGNGWQTLAPGLETRSLYPQAFTEFVVLRIDPALYTFKAHYQPDAPLYADGWRALLPNAVAFINANFFDTSGNVLGLLISDEGAFGQTFNGYGGFVQVLDDVVRVRSNIIEPYYGEYLDHAVQGFPMLVTDGLSSYDNARGDRVSRRTIAGQDSTGRILFISSASFFGMRLVELSQYLPTADLDLITAVNLDGGGSTMLSVTLPGATPYTNPSFDSVPAVLAVYPR